MVNDEEEECPLTWVEIPKKPVEKANKPGCHIEPREAATVRVETCSSSVEEIKDVES